jgi:hypothetical protein
MLVCHCSLSFKILTSDILVSPEMYFVKLDVQACFDTIEQTRLLEILRDVISQVYVSEYDVLYAELTMCLLGRVCDSAPRSDRSNDWADTAEVCQEGYVCRLVCSEFAQTF